MLHEFDIETPHRLTYGAWHGHIVFAQWLMQVVKPKVFVELGTHNGDSYFSFCQTVKKNNLPTECHAVDTWIGEDQSGFYGEEVFQSVNKYNKDNYVSFSTLHRCLFDEARELFDDSSIDVLHIDGFHSYEAVSHDFYSWLPKLNNNAVVLFHDTNEYKEGFGVHKLWQELVNKFSGKTFSFLHAHGLGVLGLGNKYPELLEKLFDANNQEKMAYRNFFSELTYLLNQPAENKRLSMENQEFKIYLDRGNGFSESDSEKVPLGQLKGKAELSLKTYEDIVNIRLDPGKNPILILLSDIRLNKKNGQIVWPEIINGNYKSKVCINGAGDKKMNEILIFFTAKNPQLFFKPEKSTYKHFSFRYKIFGFYEFANYSIIEELQHKKKMLSQSLNDSNVKMIELEKASKKETEILQEQLRIKDELITKSNQIIYSLKIEMNDQKKQLQSIRDKITKTKSELIDYKKKFFKENTDLRERIKHLEYELKEQSNRFIEFEKKSRISEQQYEEKLEQREKQFKAEAKQFERKFKTETECLEKQFEEKWKHLEQLTIEKTVQLKKELVKQNALIRENFKKEEERLEKEIKNLNEKYALFKKAEREKIIQQYNRFRLLRLTANILKYIGNPLKYYRYQSDRFIVKNSGLFDEEWYLSEYHDLYLSTVDLLKHFILYGNREGRNPNSVFDTKYYLKKYPDVKESGFNPLVHYIRYGWKEGRNPSPNFNTQQYLSVHKDAEESGINPLIHYLSSVRNERKENKIVKPLYREDELKRQKQLIQNSGMFNEKYYYTYYPDVKKSSIDALTHYLKVGFLERRNPGPDFDTSFYFEMYPDVLQSKMNPLVHYLEFGIKEHRLPKMIKTDEKRMLEQSDINDLSDGEGIKKIGGKIAVCLHLFYVDLTDEFISFLDNIPFEFDLYISTTKEEKRIIEQAFDDIKNVQLLKVKTFSNVGRDIYPFIRLFAKYLRKYDYVCKIHSKKSEHQPLLKGWRQYLLKNLLGSESSVKRIINVFENDPGVGVIFPVKYPVIEHLCESNSWGMSLNAAKKHFKDLLDDFKKDFIYPTSSMFWFRPGALEPLLSKKFRKEDFDNEKGQIDGTLAHAIERTFGLYPIKTGYSLKTTYFSSRFLQITNSIGLQKIEHNLNILFIAHDLAMAGAEMVLYSIMYWLKQHTSCRIQLLAISDGYDGGMMKDKFLKIANIHYWNDIRYLFEDKNVANSFLKIFGSIDLIYGNTIVSAQVYKKLSVLEIPFITHIHELEETIQKYIQQNVVGQMKEFTTKYIACSKQVKNNLVNNHNISRKSLKQVNAFIDIDEINPKPKSVIREKYGLRKDKVIIWGCGTIYWRKGTDLFIYTAKKLLQEGIKNFHFYWIGKNFWKEDSHKYGTWKELEEYIKKEELSDYITFLGAMESPKRFFRAGDIFYLPSREDPFPLVCLEAAECKLPVLCFKDAGGMPDFISEKEGNALPYLDTDAATNKLIELISNPDIIESKGEAARRKLLRNHVSDIAVPEILDICRSVSMKPPLVSVVIPFYNQEKYVESRMESILNQTFRDFEIIVLDDASTDNTKEKIKPYVHLPFFSFLLNNSNSGSVFKQWEKGIKAAKGKYIWIAEGDDLSENCFLENLLPFMKNQDVNLSYSASHTIDENNTINKDHYLKVGHYRGLQFDESRWKNDYVSDGTDEIINALAIRNIIPNVSGALMRKDKLLNIDFDVCSQFTCAGDWFTYLSLLSEGKIAYSAKPLNYHRIHSSSVVGTNKLKIENTIPDYYKIHLHAKDNFEIPKTNRELMIKSVLNMKNLWPEIEDSKFKNFYNVDKILG